MGVNAVVSDPADKRKLHAFTRAVAVDMESHLVARLAAAHQAFELWLRELAGDSRSAAATGPIPPAAICWQ